MKGLIIAEKPSLAMKIIAALPDNFTKHNGYFEGERYIVTFAFGHLFKLLDVEEYAEYSTGKWDRTVVLPYVPTPFKFKLKEDEGAKKQFEIIKQFVLSKDVDIIIHCGDADREGEIIIRTILEQIGNTKPVKRLWLKDQSEDTIRFAIANLEDDSNYDNLAKEGYARTYMDWLVGINLTRHITYKSNKLLPVGRVLIPIVKEIFDRDMAIKNFIPIEYYQVESSVCTNGEIVRLAVEKRAEDSTDLNSALQLSACLNSNTARVTDIKSELITKHPPKLFSLSKLQGYLSTKHKISLKSSLTIIQQLYEKGYITYPRTNTEYLTTAEQSKVKSIVESLIAEGHLLTFSVSKTVFNDSKVESHSAITPTNSFPKEGELQGNFLLIYTTIKNRFIANFLTEQTLLERTEIQIICGEELFTLSGNVVKQAGFWAYTDNLAESENVPTLPTLQIGYVVQVDFKPILKRTKTPSKLSPQALLSFLSSPFQSDENDNIDYSQLLKGVEIGTEATRTGIIENAKNYNYISETNGAYSIEPLGIHLIQTLDKLSANLYKDKTVEFSQQLKEVFKGSSTVEAVTSNVVAELASIISHGENIEITAFEERREVIGYCPVCGKPVYENSKSYSCSGYKDGCKFSLFKVNKFFDAIGKSFTKSIAISLLKNKKHPVKGCKSSKGITYNAVVILGIKNGYPSFELNFKGD